MSFFRRNASKYGAVKSEGRSSKLETAVHGILLLRQKAGELRIVKEQDNMSLGDAGVRYIADFKCEDSVTGKAFWVEAKGFEGARWPTIKRAWKRVGPGKLEIWKGSYRNPKLVEVLTPGQHDPVLCERCQQEITQANNSTTDLEA